MLIQCDQRLSHALETKLSSLIDACRQKEPISLSLPQDGQYFLWIAGAEKEALACLILCPAGPFQWECYAFTHPQSRRQGLFKALYARARDLTEQEAGAAGEAADLLFLSDGLSSDGQAALEAMDMKLQYSEYQMELSISGEKKLLGTPESETCASPLRIIRRRLSDQGLESQLYLAFLPSSSLPEKRPFCAGTCRILPYGSGRFYLYHLEITESFRSRGFGRALLFGVLNSLPSRSRVILQVSSENTAALSLYKKTGFGITKTLSYYRQDIPDVQ